MYEIEESGDIDIEWDVPRPVKPIPSWGPRQDVWWKKLSPMKRFPGRRARILRDFQTGEHARGQRSNIIRALLTHDEFDRWKIESGKEDDGTWSIWATYEGRMNESEHAKWRAERTALGIQIKTQILRGKLRNREKAIVERSTLSASLRPPVYSEE